MTIDTEKWNELQRHVARLKREISKVIVGQADTVEMMLAALFSRGHCLIVGVPGLGKTLLVRTFGRVLGLSFHRIQFTPDLMPTDIVGSEILQAADGGVRRFEFSEGPIFANLLLADEINRTPPKTQSALLEAMQERQVTVAGVTRTLQEPFTVFATQNPIEHEGTYPLPEAQLDRFFFHINVDYPSMDDERAIVLHSGTPSADGPEEVLTRGQVLEMQDAVTEIPMPDHAVDFILRLVQSTRPHSALADDHVKRLVAWGAGPRASQTLHLAAKALALLRGRTSASVQEVRDAALPVLRHRVIPNYNATGEGVTSDDIIRHLLSTQKVA
ncbi:MAG: MoxR family ATPase [Terrimicrobiaceae bacterium]|nr:MoxR family ATPase [Terrimicrobiaceae bacterium]